MLGIRLYGGQANGRRYVNMSVSGETDDARHAVNISRPIHLPTHIMIINNNDVCLAALKSRAINRI